MTYTFLTILDPIAPAEAGDSMSYTGMDGNEYQLVRLAGPQEHADLVALLVDSGALVMGVYRSDIKDASIIANQAASSFYAVRGGPIAVTDPVSGVVFEAVYPAVVEV